MGVLLNILIVVQMMKGGPTPLADMTSAYATQRNLLASNYSGELLQRFFLPFDICNAYSMHSVIYAIAHCLSVRSTQVSILSKQMNRAGFWNLLSSACFKGTSYIYLHVSSHPASTSVCTAGTRGRPPIHVSAIAQR